jgi:hypothetical protein
VAARGGGEVLQEVMARRAGFSGLTTEGTITAKRQNESYTLPFSLTVSADLQLEVRGEISHFLLPFSGEFRLVGDTEATLLYTGNGVYDLAPEPEAQEAMRAFMLSLAGGGDWLLWWLAENGCETSQRSTCKGLEVEIEPAGTLPAVGRWEIRETSQGRVFRAKIEEYQPGTLMPRTITGTLYPEEISIFVSYTRDS